jgi:hypothetical protein
MRHRRREPAAISRGEHGYDRQSPHHNDGKVRADLQFGIA